MTDHGITKAEMESCVREFERFTKQDDEKERTWLTYEELKVGLENVLERNFSSDRIFFKMVSELHSLEPNKV